MSGTIEPPEPIECCECYARHPMSGITGGRKAAVADGWLIGNDGWVCLRCNAEDGQQVLH